MNDITKFLRNVSCQGSAWQSSLSKWSHNMNEAQNALTGFAPDGYAFHTKSLDHNYWCVDIKEILPIRCIVVHNRFGFHSRYINKQIPVSISIDMETWEYCGELNLSDPTSSAILDLKNRHARFIKISSAFVPLHFRQVEIYTDIRILAFKNLNLSIDPIISTTILNSLMDQSYEHQELNTVLMNSEDRDIFLELGASLGVMSSYIKSYFPKNSYFAVEANPYLIPIIIKNHQLNNISDVNIIEGAVSNKSGVGNLYISNNCWGSSLIELENFKEIKKVMLLDINELLKLSKANFLICDIEGGEYNIFNNNINLTNINKICIEFHNDIKSMQNLYNFFISKGFKSEKQLPMTPGPCVYYFYKK